MKTAYYIARKYLFSKKSSSIINIISAISVFGIFISSAAMIIVLSGFNGIENLVSQLYSSFDPDIRIEATEGKTFDKNLINVAELKSIEGVAYASASIEEITLVKNGERWATTIMKGVERTYFDICDLDSKIEIGQGKPEALDAHFGILGMGVNNQLNAISDWAFETDITIYGLLRSEKLSKKNTDALKPELLRVTGVFSINPDFNDKYIVVPLHFATELLEYGDDVTCYELGIHKNADSEFVRAQVQELLGDDFVVKTRYQMNEVMFKTNETEKLMVSVILAFILLLSTFNIIASLTLIILDKKKDITTIIALGGTLQLVKKIFFLEGLLINLLGGIGGIALGTLVCWLQAKFHLITIENAVVDHWPVEIKWMDFILILGTVVTIGTLSSYLPVNYLIKKHFRKLFNN